MLLAQPNPVALVQALDRALERAPTIDRHAQHHRVRVWQGPTNFLVCKPYQESISVSRTLQARESA